MPTETPPPARRPRELRTKVITVPGNLQQACHEFNTHRFFECHETLEEIWQEEQSEVRDLYKGLIQVAAGFVHVTRGNYIGANRLFTTALGYLTPYRAEGALGFDVDRICRETERAHAALLADGPANVTFDPALVPVFACEIALLPAEATRWRAWGFDREGNERPMEITVPD